MKGFKDWLCQAFEAWRTRQHERIARQRRELDERLAVLDQEAAELRKRLDEMK